MKEVAVAPKLNVKVVIVILIHVLLIGCDSTEDNLQHKGGVAISFDDHFIDEWYQLRPVFKQHGAKVTFFITCSDTISETKRRLLQDLQEDGHEIGFHGTIHGNATQLLSNAGVNGYISTELEPGMKYMRQAGFHPTSYAHPGGNHTQQADSVLLAQGFTILRDVAKNERSLYGIRLYHLPPRYMPHIYYTFDNDRTVDALTIDTDVHISQEEIREALIKARDTGTALMLFGHKPLNKEPGEGEYGFRVSFLKYTLAQADSLDLQFYTMSELPALSAQRPKRSSL
ncbi:polysaccharide deacetylase family protein [Telluribacter sp. SYSU D00476]|uniref:polysaccharide deacetylase family protein n=1 Tax=Telluribacter sp. SYSU D00476 TaxID=2811430 RepID=UPI001FF37D3F|nr:polysaccharide deacetylase family protein [Telluribacter sp. SYSU D00476]